MDRVFLLSEAELLEFFPEQEQRTCQATEYAKAQGAYVDETTAIRGGGCARRASGPWMRAACARTGASAAMAAGM